MFEKLTRRGFLAGTPAAGVAVKTGLLLQGAVAASGAPSTAQPALLGGPKARKTMFDAWPKFDMTEEKALLDVLRSGHWFRGNGQNVKTFEEKFAAMTGAKQALATCNGTSALFISLNILGVEPGDEVIVPPYTFIATINAVLRAHALPVFVDSDLETFQMDARKIEAAVNKNTRAMIPVHLGGNVCDIDTIGAIGSKHNIPVIEDACQAHLAEWKGKRVGTYGSAGCFSFQASKNLTSGEGGAILFNDEDLREQAYAFHNNGSGLKFIGTNFSYRMSGTNMRLTEFQAALLLCQMNRLEAQAKTRAQNAKYLTSMLREIPGITPAKQYAGTTNNAYHLYMLRYDPQGFNGLPRDKFMKALAAEGIPGSTGYAPLNTQPFLKTALESRGFKRLFSAARLKQWQEQNHCPQNDKLCTEAVWMTQNMLLGSRSDMDQIADAFRKIQAHSGELLKA